MRLIDADAFKAEMRELYRDAGWDLREVHYSQLDMECNIDMMPTIEAEPKHGVIELTYEEYGELCSYALADEPKHGEWLIDKSGSLMCSKCGTLLDEFQKPSRFCPNCGAKMDLPEPQNVMIINDGTYSAGEEEPDGQ